LNFNIDINIQLGSIEFGIRTALTQHIQHQEATFKRHYRQQ